MKTLWKICKLVIMLLLTGVIVWTVLYFTVPKVKDWTNDKVFKIDQSKDDEEKKQLRADNEVLKKQINSLTTEATTVSAELTNVKDQLTAKTTALETATSEKQELTSKVSKLEQKVSELETSGAATQTELEAKKQELATAQTSLQEKTAEVETLTAEKQTLENQKTTLESQLADKQNQIQELQNRVEQLESELNPSDEGYTYEELKQLGFKFGLEATGNNTYYYDDNLDYYQLWTIKNNKYIPLKNPTTSYQLIKFGNKDLFVSDTNSYLIDKNINIEEYDTPNLLTSIIPARTGYSKYYSFYMNDNKFLIAGNKIIITYNLETKELSTYDVTFSADLNTKVFYFSDKNTIHISIGNSYYFYNFNTQTQTTTDIEVSKLLKVDNNKYLCGQNTLYLLNMEDLSFTMLKDNFSFSFSLILDNGDTLISCSYYPGLYVYNKETSTIQKIDSTARALMFKKLNSGKIVCSAYFEGTKGIYVFENNSLTKIYNDGFFWDIIVEDENGCTFSSKYDPSQGSVYYNYSTGECTAVAN